MNNSLVLSAFVKELSLWRKENEQNCVEYYVIDKVYPFQNPAKLLEVVQEIQEKDAFFIISVMPVYNHEDYPAMQQFCEVLKYAQDNGGMIFLYAPVNQMDSFDVDLVNEYLSLAISAYVKQGVYPMGLQVPKNWIRNNDTVEIMSRFKTIMVSENVDDWIEEDWSRVNGNLVYQMIINGLHMQIQLIRREITAFQFIIPLCFPKIYGMHLIVFTQIRILWCIRMDRFI